MGTLISPSLHLKSKYGGNVPTLVAGRTNFNSSSTHSGTRPGHSRILSRRSNSGGCLLPSGTQYSQSAAHRSYSRPRSASFDRPARKKRFGTCAAESLSGYRSNRYPLIKGGSLSERSSRTSSLASVSSNSSNDWPSEIDFKLLYETKKAENEKLIERIRHLEVIFNELEPVNATCGQNGFSVNDEVVHAEFSGPDNRQNLERRIMELEKIAKSLEQLKLDNHKLKEENGALIRVISKLSR